MSQSNHLAWSVETIGLGVAVIATGHSSVSLQRHRRLDVLPDREATSVAAWLQRSPSIEIISRDRSDIYATAARLGAPQAIQVTDKWHLLKNLGEAAHALSFPSSDGLSKATDEGAC
jgi:transposase